MSRSGKIILVLTMALLAGCVRRTMTIQSDPPGALVYMNHQEVGRTPVTREFIWYGAYDVQLRKEGYETLSTEAYVVAPPWLWPPFDLICEILPIPLHDHHTRSYSLKPAATQPIDQTIMLARAAELQARLESSEFTHPPTTQSTSRPTTRSATRPTTQAP